MFLTIFALLLGIFHVGGSAVVNFPNSSSGDTLRAWNTLVKLVDDRNILQQLYFEIAGVGDELYEFDAIDDPAQMSSRIVNILRDYNPDTADLFPLHFATEPGFSKNISNENFFILNHKVFRSPDDLFYLKSSDLAAQRLIFDSVVSSPEEVILGSNEKAPLVQFYGCDRVSSWESFNRNLLTECQAGKIRFLWRSTCPNDQSFKFEPSAVALTVKKSQWGKLVDLPLDLPDAFKNGENYAQKVSDAQLRDLDKKVSTTICDLYEKTQDFSETFNYMKQVINNFPALAHKLANIQVSDSKLVQAVDKTEKNGIDHTMLGIYINGQYHKLSNLDKISILQAVTAEATRIDLIRKLLQIYEGSDDEQSTILAKELVQKFSAHSQSTLQNSQPAKYDLHRVAGFSESVIYFNDIENDAIYKEKLNDNIAEFFKKSEFGHIPAYRENWNEVIFVINLSELESKDTVEALQGLVRAISVVENGHPQRIGFLPMVTKSQDMGILRRIYELKSGNLKDLAKYLQELSVGSGLKSSEFENIPPVLDILESKLKLKNSSIIVNGEVYPFKSNLWNYMIAKVIKKDVSYIKDELRRINAADVLTAREILHRRSFTERNLKLAPDYFEDATYYVTNVTALKLLGTRLVEFTKSTDHNMLHTITIVDDFDTPLGLKRLLNATKIGLLGVRIRAIHTGAESKQWLKMRVLLEKLSFNNIEKILSNMKTKASANLIEHSILNLWIFELPSENSVRKSFMTINGRFVQFEDNEVLSPNEYEMILQREALRVLDATQALQDILPHFVSNSINPDLIEMLSSVLTKMFYDGQRFYNNGIDYTAEGSLSRVNLEEFVNFNAYNSFQLYSDIRKVDITLIVDPLEERTQKLLTLVSELMDLKFVNIRLHLLPTNDLKVFPIHRFWLENSKVRPEMEELDGYYVDVERPFHWHIGPLTRASAEFEYAILEINAFGDSEVPSKGLVEGVGNVCLQLVNEHNEVVDKTFTSTTFGYGQLRLYSLERHYRIESCSEDFRVTSFSLDAHSNYAPIESFDLASFSPMRAYVKIRKESSSLPVESFDPRKSSVDIFSIAEDRNQEDELKGLIASILKSNLENGIKMWILMGESPSTGLLQFLSKVSTNYENRIQFELLKYDWPRWLRPQRFREDEVAALKVLMLDYIFPDEVDKLIYLEPGARIEDLKALWKFQFDTAFCLPRAYYSNGRPYWKEGYWQDFLSKHNLKFHAIDPAFIVNLTKYRNEHVGEKFRIHYQRLSAGINFLARIDQDLINDMQLKVPLSTLRKSLVAQNAFKRDGDKENLEVLYKEFSQESEAARANQNDFDHDEL
ncbi:LAFA_0C09296g1_1 [Lachancea sp. 'fantastica']|nr:LAFA_0C09296g1_1 [Lachancea sp. 'fantastica']